MKTGLIPMISASLLRSQTGENCDFDIGDDWNRFKADNGESVLSFDLPSWWDRYLNLFQITSFSIDTSDNTDSVKQNGDEVEFYFNTMIYRWAFLQNVNFRWLFSSFYQFQNSNGHGKCAAWTNSTNELFR